MKFSVLRSDLLSACRVVSAAVDKKTNADDILFSGVALSVNPPFLILKTTDRELEVKTQVPVEGEATPGVAVICFRKLSEVARALPEGAVIFFEKGEKMRISSGKSRYILSLLSHDTFPEFGIQTGLASLKLKQAQFRAWVESVMFAISEQDIRLYLNGLLVEYRDKKLYAVASDGHRLALHSLSEASVGALSSFRALLPKKAVLACLKLLEDPDGLLLFELGSRHFRLVASGHQLKGHLLEANFPAYERLIPSTAMAKLWVDKKVFKSALNRVSALFSDRFKAVNLKLDGQNLNLSAETPDLHDKMEESVVVAHEGEPIQTVFNVRYLLDCLQAIPDERVILTFTGLNSSTLVQGENERAQCYLIMPMRV